MSADGLSANCGYSGSRLSSAEYSAPYSIALSRRNRPRPKFGHQVVGRMSPRDASMTADRTAVERFLFHEARLMDEHRYDDWLALWALEAATYWIPANTDDADPAQNVSIIYDRRGQLRNRIQRLKETLWLKERAPRLKRIVGNIEVVAEDGIEITVNSNFIL